MLFPLAGPVLGGDQPVRAPPPTAEDLSSLMAQTLSSFSAPFARDFLYMLFISQHGHTCTRKQ